VARRHALLPAGGGVREICCGPSLGARPAISASSLPHSNAAGLNAAAAPYSAKAAAGPLPGSSLTLIAHAFLSAISCRAQPLPFRPSTRLRSQSPNMPRKIASGGLSQCFRRKCACFCAERSLLGKFAGIAANSNWLMQLSLRIATVSLGPHFPLAAASPASARRMGRSPPPEMHAHAPFCLPFDC
jgi:hypothetical protein